MLIRLNNAVAAIAIGGLVSSPAFAKADELRDLVGARAAGGEYQLQTRGYEHYATHKDDYTSHAFWWNSQSKDCVQVDTENGRYASIVDVSGSDCGHKNNTGAVVAAVAGIAVIAALIASRKRDKDYSGYSREEQRHYDRGFRDGYSNNRFNNYSQSRAYSKGWSEGVRARNNGSDYNHNRPSRPSYSARVRIDDLRGDRAAGAMRTLSQRGFRQVDNFATGNTRYSIQWRQPSRQCVQVGIANGRVVNIRDIGRHPRCR